MKKLLLTLAILFTPSLALAQCNGVFPNNTACGNVTGASNTPRPIPLSSFPAATPGGVNGDVQYNNAGTFGGEHQVTTTQGGTGASNATNSANDVLASNGANGTFVHTALTTLLHTVCTLSPSTCGFILGYYSADWYGVIGYAPTDLSTTGCLSGAAAGPDDSFPLAAASNQPFKVRLPSNRCYKITQEITLNTNGGGLYGDRTATIWMPAANFNSTTLCSTLNCLNSNSLGLYIQGQLTTPFTSAYNITFDGFRIISEVADGRAVGPIAMRNCSACAITNMELAGFPVAAGLYIDTVFYSHFDNNYIHDFTTNAVWGTAPGIQAISADGSRVNGIGSRWNSYNGNNIQNIIFGSVPAATYTQQPVGIGVYTVADSSGNPLGENTISNNIINTTGECIDLYASRTTVVGNTVLNCEIAGISVKHGGSYDVVGHNTIFGTGQYGMTLSGGAAAPASNENLFDGNVVIELDPNALHTSAITACFRFNNNGQTFGDSKNIIQNTYCDATGGKYGIYGDSSDGSGNFFNNNFIIGYSTAALAVATATAVQSGGYTVSTLPSCTGNAGIHAYVTDFSGTPTYHGAVGSGGGSTPTPVFCNNSAWITD